MKVKSFGKLIPIVSVVLLLGQVLVAQQPGDGVTTDPGDEGALTDGTKAQCDAKSGGCLPGGGWYPLPAGQGQNGNMTKSVDCCKNGVVHHLLIGVYGKPNSTARCYSLISDDVDNPQKPCKKAVEEEVIVQGKEVVGCDCG